MLYTMLRNICYSFTLSSFQLTTDIILIYILSLSKILNILIRSAMYFDI